MAKLIYSAIASLDGYVEDSQGKFGWAAPDDEVHAFVNPDHGPREGRSWTRPGSPTVRRPRVLPHWRTPGVAACATRRPNSQTCSSVRWSTTRPACCNS